MKLKGHVLKYSFPCQIVDLKHNLVRNHKVVGTALNLGIAEHHVDELSVGKLAHILFADVFSVADDGTVVGNLPKLLKLVGNVGYNNILFLELSDHFKECGNLMTGKGRSGLVKLKHLGVELMAFAISII